MIRTGYVPLFPLPHHVLPYYNILLTQFLIKCSYHRLTWSSHKNQVVFHIMRILNETMDRATKIVKSIRPSRAAVWRQKVKRYTGDNEIHPSGLRIVDRKRGRIYSRRDDFSGRLLDFEDD
jgi:hypothetical protein